MRPYGKDLGEFVYAYLECALWSSTDEADEQGGSPLDANYSIEKDMDAESVTKMGADCTRFVRENAADLSGLDAAQSGHDFWLTRNHHGSGFWDRGYEKELGERLTKRAHLFGESSLYVGDDGRIYVT